MDICNGCCMQFEKFTIARAYRLYKSRDATFTFCLR